jgi:hypothetical protein
MRLRAQELFPPVSPGGYMSSSQPQNEYNPAMGSQHSVVPSQPTTIVRPDAFPGGTPLPSGASGENPPTSSANAAPRPYGPIYQPGQQYLNGGGLAGGAGQPPFPGAPSTGLLAAPAQLCEGAQILGRVGTEVILTCDVRASIDDMISRAKSRIPPDKVAEQRAALAQEVTDCISDFNSHYKEPDPAKAMTLPHRALLNQLVQQQIDNKLMYQDFLKTVPKDALAGIEDNLRRHFEDSQLTVLMKRENVVSRADLENALRAKGSSLDREKRIFMEQVVAQQWFQQKVKPDAENSKSGDTEITHEQMLAWYQAHIKDFEKPAKARWEELMVSFSRHSDRDEAYKAMAALGNRVIAGASLADVAKSSSEGATARQGGQWDWTNKGTLSSDVVEQALFGQPVGQLSPQILESPTGYHIVRVVERQDQTRMSFLDAQKEVKQKIQKERMEQRYKDFVKNLRAKYPVWTVFDNAFQVPKNPDDEDRYATH